MPKKNVQRFRKGWENTFGKKPEVDRDLIEMSCDPVKMAAEIEALRSIAAYDSISRLPIGEGDIIFTFAPNMQGGEPYLMDNFIVFRTIDALRRAAKVSPHSCVQDKEVFRVQWGVENEDKGRAFFLNPKINRVLLTPVLVNGFDWPH